MDDIKEILRLMPHRYPFLLVDRIIDFNAEDGCLTALKNVTFNEPFFTGHFPENPVMPGVLQLEAMAQATALLAFKTIEARSMKKLENGLFLFAGIDKARFKQPVMPGDQLIITTKVLKEKAGIWKSFATVKVEGKLVCSAELLAAYREVK